MMDCVVPGGVAADLAPEGTSALRALTAEVRARFAVLVGLLRRAPRPCRTAPSRTGIVRPELVRRFGAGGYVGRASGRAFDCARGRRAIAPYDALRFDVPMLHGG